VISPAHELLLRAALAQDDRASEYLRAWDASNEFDAIDHAAFCLLPMLYATLVERRLGTGWRHLGRAGGVFRQNWYRNQLFLASLKECIDAFSAAGIPTMILKGAALALAYYPRPACRAMGDVDILVPAARAVEAAAVATAAGLAPRFPGFWPPRISASKPFRHRKGWDVDLHVHVLHECLAPDADEAFWKAAVPVDVLGSPSLMLAPEDLLLHVIVHAGRSPLGADPRWIPDAVMILRGAPAFSWPLFYERAAERRLTLQVGLALRFLRDRFALAVPDDVLTRFDRTPSWFPERAAAFGRRTSGWTAVVAMGTSDLLRLRRHDADFRGPLGPVRYLRWTYGLESSWDVPRKFARGVMRRTRRALFREGTA